MVVVKGLLAAAQQSRGWVDALLVRLLAWLGWADIGDVRHYHGQFMPRGKDTIEGFILDRCMRGVRLHGHRPVVQALGEWVWVLGLSECRRSYTLGVIPHRVNFITSEIGARHAISPSAASRRKRRCYRHRAATQGQETAAE